MEYIIKGDAKYGSCLVLVCGKSYKSAEESLNRMLTNPDENDKKLIKDHTNLRIEEVEDKDCWWNFGCD